MFGDLGWRNRHKKFVARERVHYFLRFRQEVFRPPWSQAKSQLQFSKQTRAHYKPKFSKEHSAHRHDRKFECGCVVMQTHATLLLLCTTPCMASGGGSGIGMGERACPSWRVQKSGSASSDAATDETAPAAKAHVNSSAMAILSPSSCTDAADTTCLCRHGYSQPFAGAAAAWA